MALRIARKCYSEKSHLSKTVDTYPTTVIPRFSTVTPVMPRTIQKSACTQKWLISFIQIEPQQQTLGAFKICCVLQELDLNALFKHIHCNKLESTEDHHLDLFGPLRKNRSLGLQDSRILDLVGRYS